MDELVLDRKAAAIADALANLAPGYAMTILHRAQGRVLSSAPESELISMRRLPPINPVFLERRKGRRSKIENDPAVQQFIHKHLNCTYNEIVKRCVAEFSPERSPSRYSLGRYIQKLRTAQQEEKSCDTRN